MPKCRITIEEIQEEGQTTVKKPIVFEIEHYSFTDERGIAKPNGQRRLTIKGWSGCPSYEKYNEKRTVTFDEVSPLNEEVFNILDRTKLMSDNT